jgi:hypothetical protein
MKYRIILISGCTAILACVLVAVVKYAVTVLAASGAAQDRSLRTVAATVSADDELLFDEPATNVGETKLRKISHVFKFRNVSTTTIYITDIRSSCACTVSRPNQPAFAPRESGEIAVTVDISSRAPGTYRFNADVLYRGTKESVKQLSLTLTNSPDVHVIPESLSFTLGDRKSSLLFDLVDSRDKPLKVLSYESSSVALSVHTVQEPREYRPGPVQWLPANWKPEHYLRAILLLDVRLYPPRLQFRELQHERPTGRTNAPNVPDFNVLNVVDYGSYRNQVRW